MSKNGTIYVIPKGFGVSRSLKEKGKLKSGPNEFTRNRMPFGTLIPLAKKYGVAVCTISRWIRKGKLKPRTKT